MAFVTPHAETMLTWGLAGMCLLLALTSRAPHLLVRHAEIEREQIDLTVSVQGEVGRPGVYRLPWGARVEDLLAAAGGMTPEAEPALVQLADPLSDGETVIVPGRRSTIGEGRVDVNSASVLELEQLPGVGPAIAAKIVAGRPYARIEDLLRVSGIGERTLERLRPLVTL